MLEEAGVGWKVQRGRVLPLLTIAGVVSSVFVGGKICVLNLGDGHGPDFIGNREGLVLAAKMWHLWIGAED